MATPLRKDEPTFEQEEITTADLAQGKRPVGEARGPQAVTSDAAKHLEATAAEQNWNRATLDETRAGGLKPVGGTTTGGTASPLIPSSELDALRTRWQAIQTGFVDEPRKAVQDADGLVASAMKRLAEVFADERAGLERQWDRGDSVSTEDLRVALQRYRTFFERLLSV